MTPTLSRDAVLFIACTAVLFAFALALTVGSMLALVVFV